MTPDERTELIVNVRHSDAGLALIEYLSIRMKECLSELTLADSNDSGRVGRLQGSIIELSTLENILKADFEKTAERLELEAQSARGRSAFEEEAA